MKLSHLLKEINNTPKAIFLAGAAGSGKSWIINQLLPKDFAVINVDDTYEALLKSTGLNLNQKDFTPDQLSQAGQLMGQAQKITREKYAELLKSMNNLIIDGTGAASKPLIKKKQEIESLGYKTFMIMVYVSPLTALKRNFERSRNLLPSIVLRTWAGVYSNIDEYKSTFNTNIVIINNDPEDADRGYDAEKVKPFLDQTKAKGKPKTPEEQEKSRQKFQELNSDIKSLIMNPPETENLNTAKSKINQFIKQ
jgi:predicted kinase